MSSTPVIRPSVAGDVAAITAIYAFHVRHGTASFEREPPDEAEMTRRREGVLALGLPHLVAEIDGVVVGYAYASPYRPRPAYEYSVETSVYVVEGVHRRGVGRASLEALIAACKDAGRRELIAIIGDSANVGSIKLHERLGFHHVGKLRNVGFKHGRWLDTVLMQLSLHEASKH